jgi:hypothetical protein
VEEGQVPIDLDVGTWHTRSGTKKPFPGSYRFLEPTAKEAMAMDRVLGGAMPTTDEDFCKFVFNALQAMGKMSHYHVYNAATLYRMADQNCRMQANQTTMIKRIQYLEKQVEALRSKVGGPIVEAVGRKLLPVELKEPKDTPEMKKRADALLDKVRIRKRIVCIRKRNNKDLLSVAFLHSFSHFL